MIDFHLRPWVCISCALGAGALGVACSSSSSSQGNPGGQDGGGLDAPAVTDAANAQADAPTEAGNDGGLDASGLEDAGGNDGGLGADSADSGDGADDADDGSATAAALCQEFGYAFAPGDICPSGQSVCACYTATSNYCYVGSGPPCHCCLFDSPYVQDGGDAAPGDGGSDGAATD